MILLDEVDGYAVAGAGLGGDQVSLAVRRGETFWNRRIVMGSTPTQKKLSRIDRAYQDTDQRKFYVPCPQCGEHQVLEWGGKDTPHGIKWHKDENGVGLPETAYYACRHNGCIIEEADKPTMVAAGEWRATKPFKGRAGFHIWSGYSLHVNAAWAKLVAEWLEKKGDPKERKTFVNEVLGESFEDFGDNALSERKLAAQAEVWAAEVPDGVGVITAAGDTQDDRVEIEIVGWGRNEERWSIAHEVFAGDPGNTELWDQVDVYLKRRWSRADGRQFEVMAACIDSGGHHSERVYQFAKARLGRRIWAVKGESARGGSDRRCGRPRHRARRARARFDP